MTGFIVTLLEFVEHPIGILHCLSSFKKKKLSFDFKDIMCFSVAVQQITTK